MKLLKFHWNIRLGLENIKKAHAMMLQDVVYNKKLQKNMEGEINKYIEDAYDQHQAYKMQDVFVTDHKTKPKKYHTNNSKEDRAFFELKQKIKEYNADAASIEDKPESQGYFEQDFKERLPGSVVLSDGCMYYKVDADELVPDEEEAEAEYELRKAASEEVSDPEDWALDDDDEDDDDDDGENTGINNPYEMNLEDPFYQKVFDDEETDYAKGMEVLAKMDAFKEGEEYEFVTDLKRGFSQALEKPLEDKLIDLLPDYVFWDIKEHLNKTELNNNIYNRANPLKPKQYLHFFDHRNTLEYFHRNHRKPNMNDHRSLFRKY